MRNADGYRPCDIANALASAAQQRAFAIYYFEKAKEQINGTQAAA